MYFPGENKDSHWKTNHMDYGKIQIAPARMIADTMTIWPDVGPEVDLVADPRLPGGLKFRPGTLKVIYAVGILGLSPFDRVEGILSELRGLLAPEGQLYIIENDYDFINRALLGGDLAMEQFNREFIQQSYLNHDILVNTLEKVGFSTESMVVWYKFPNLKFDRKEHQIIISAIKK